MLIPPLPEHVTQALQPINVVVQQPAGTPEWVKILVTGVVGAIFGILSSPASELLKAWISSIPKRKKIRRQLIDELIDNLDVAERAGSKMIEKSYMERGESEIIAVGRTAVGQLHTDQFDHYFDKEKDFVYEIDQERCLAEFYRLLKATLEDPEWTDVEFVITSFKLAILQAHHFLRKQKVSHERQKTLWEERLDKFQGKKV